MPIYELWIKNLPGCLDYYDGFVVRASSPEQARKLAQKRAGKTAGEGPDAWLDPKQSVCRAVNPNTKRPAIILDSFNAG